MADFRTLCSDLLEALENAISIIYREDGTKHISSAKPIVERARAALADEPAVPEGREPAAVTGQPSDEELTDLWSWAAGQDQGPWPTQQHCFARAVLARWGNPVPAPPADGELEWLVAALSDRSRWMQLTDAQVDRAAELLQRQVPEVRE